MSSRYKNILYSLVVLITILIVYHARKDKETAELIHVQGQTMGTISYNVKYFDDNNRWFEEEIDSLLKVFNKSLNTYIPESEISRFNRDSVFIFESPYFKRSLEVTKELSEATAGAFNPTIMPLVNFWGFGPDLPTRLDSAKIDSLKNLVNYGLVAFDNEKVWKLNKQVSLDYSASAKGYGVDVIAEFLNDNSINNYFIEIGGEVRTNGQNLESNKPWTVGVLDPRSTKLEQSYYAVVKLTDRAMATSGNYFNYRVVDGVRYSHTLDPQSGYPVEHNILSATVTASDCMTADALATAFMVMGHEKAIDFLNNHPEYSGLILYTSDDGSIKHFATNELSITYL